MYVAERAREVNGSSFGDLYLTEAGGKLFVKPSRRDRNFFFGFGIDLSMHRIDFRGSNLKETF